MSTAIEKVRIELAKRRVRIEEHFADFDKLRSGNVSQDQFKRCLAITITLAALSEADMTALIYSYKSRDGLGVNYKAFMADVNAEEVPQSALSPTRTGRQLSDEMEMALAKMTEFFVHRITTTGLDVRQCFRDFDRHNCGKITTAQFERSFPFKIEPRFLHSIEEKYSDGNGNIMYLGWCNDVYSAIQGPRNTSSQSYAEAMATRQAANAQTGSNAELLVEQLRAQMAAKRLRLDEQLRDYDKNHSGLITVPQFSACLGRLPLSRMSLKESDIQALASRYGVDDGSGIPKVQYGLFLDDMDISTHPTVGQTASENTLSAQDELQVSVILDKVRAAIRTRRVNLKPTFQDFDRAVKGIYQSRTCTRTRFERALAVNKITLSTAEMSLIARKYAMRQADGTLEDDINYHTFCAAVDMGGDAPEALSSTAGTTTLNTANLTAKKNITEILDKVMLQCVDRRIRLTTFLRDFDSLRSGTIPNSKFASALGIAGVQLTQAEFEEINVAFANPNLIDHIDLNAFLAAADTGVVINNHDSPTVPARDNESALRDRLRSTEEGNAGDRAPQLEQILRRVSEAVRSKGILLPPFFHDYDKHHSGRITRVQFTQVLSRHRLPLSQSDVELLCQVYADAVDPQQIRYRGFIGAVDETENVKSMHSQRAAVRAAGGIPGQPNLNATMGTASADAVLQKIANFVQRRCARIEEFFHDKDPLRKGRLHEAKFRSAVDMTGLLLTEAEHIALATAFRSDDGEGHNVSYVHFMQSLEGVLPNNSASAAAPSDIDPFTAKLLEKVRHSLESRRLTTRPLFQDADKLRKGHVTEAQFFAALTAVNLRFAPIEADALRGFLKSDNGTMAYLKFCQLVDPAIA